MNKWTCENMLSFWVIETSITCNFLFNYRSQNGNSIIYCILKFPTGVSKFGKNKDNILCTILYQF